jgi:phenylacetate-coenzyme A ligase PaaK-like adenylate-forming protein
MAPARTPLDDWIRAKIDRPQGAALTQDALETHQLAKLRETVAYVRARSPFYRQRLKTLPDGFPASLDNLARVPFTTADDIRADPMRFLCVSQSRVARIVTLQTSGTTDRPKRLFFTEGDLELTIEFFHHGMSGLVKPDWRVLILMPGKLPGSVGDLLVKGLARMNVDGIVHGLATNLEAAIQEMIDKEIDSLVGLPVQVLGLARHPAAARIPAGRIQSVLLSADYVPDAVTAVIGGIWHCPVFAHYGMTEMGLGGGVECAARDGYHLREADLLFEIVHPDTGEPIVDDAPGEVVFTTLTRRAMPLIRYRTGDLAAWKTTPCPCGSAIRRMGKVMGRREGERKLDAGTPIRLPRLDEAVFAVDGVLDYQAEIRRSNGPSQLWIILRAVSPAVGEAVRRALVDLPEVSGLEKRGRLKVMTATGDGPASAPATTAIKRRILDRRSESGGHP